MDYYSILDRNSPSHGVEPSSEADLTQIIASQSQPSVSAAIAAANALSGTYPELAETLRFPGDDGGRSLADMAQRDLDAALQLLADRAQYITGASGAAIALRRRGQSDMLCRASAGSNAPELGVLLSAEFGLSGESVRTRLALRCDDTERDPRVNREGCRQLGIASVVVMPIASDDEVLGVFELFSGKVNAFDDRDLTALQRLGEMVETAVKLAHAAGDALGEGPGEGVSADEISEEAPAEQEQVVEVETEIAAPGARIEASGVKAPDSIAPTVTATPAALAVPGAPAKSAAPKKPLLWSAALSASGAEKPAEPDQSHVPPVLRNLHKCQACGFPVSEGRVLCVDCEEKQWRGQLRIPQPGAPQQPLSASSGRGQEIVSSPPLAKAAAASAVSTAAAATPTSLRAGGLHPGTLQEPAAAAKPAALVVPEPMPPVPETAPSPESSTEDVPASSAEAPVGLSFLASGTTAQESWLASNKYILGALLVVAAVVAAVVLIH